jgi:hypothetical protein
VEKKFITTKIGKDHTEMPLTNKEHGLLQASIGGVAAVVI